MMRIQTERLVLEPLVLADLDDLLALHAHPEVTEWLGGLDTPTARERLADNERQFRERGHGRMAIRDRRSGAFLGRSGLLYWPQFDEVEVGWTLIPSAWGHGYATEAARACIEWGFEHLTVPYLTAMIQASNERSVAVATRLGFTPLRNDVVLDVVPVIVHALERY
jgi:RimJ/RimL family protein N-acetyltransferase